MKEISVNQHLMRLVQSHVETQEEAHNSFYPHLSQLRGLKSSAQLVEVTSMLTLWAQLCGSCVEQEEHFSASCATFRNERGPAYNAVSRSLYTFMVTPLFGPWEACEYGK